MKIRAEDQWFINLIQEFQLIGRKAPVAICFDKINKINVIKERIDRAIKEQLIRT